MEQRTDEWYQARLGKATASRFKDVLATIKSGESAARAKYRSELVIERLTKAPIERYQGSAMQWGTDTENLARVEYTLKTGNLVDEAGFYEHPSIMAGASPDGLIGEDGLLEIKCREVYNHIKMLRADEVSSDYLPQIQGALWITGREWCDFVSFVPELPLNAQLFVRRITRDTTYIDMLAQSVSSFLVEVDYDITFLTGYKPKEFSHAETHTI